MGFFGWEDAMQRFLRIIKVGVLLAWSILALADNASSIKEAAEQGNAQAQAKLASLYVLGREGVERTKNWPSNGWKKQPTKVSLMPRS